MATATDTYAKVEEKVKEKVQEKAGSALKGLFKR